MMNEKLEPQDGLNLGNLTSPARLSHGFHNLFPGCSANVREVDLDKLAQEFFITNGVPPEGAESPFLDPVFCQNRIDELHRALGTDWSFGGYFEDRSSLWHGSYMKEDQRFIHLGVDFNLPTGTVVASPVNGVVVVVDDDFDISGGWGPRVIIQPQTGRPEVDSAVLLFAHLRNVQVQPGQQVTAGMQIAEIGEAPFNGNWYPHLHLQAIDSEHFKGLIQSDLSNLDGYAPAGDMTELKRRFPDPVAIVRSA
jgi:murein DD-endopeptidase MepM/ murein hydrolase activator NlpD